MLYELMRTVRVPRDSEGNYVKYVEVPVDFGTPGGRCCGCFGKALVDPIPLKFSVPTDGSVVTVEDWITGNGGKFLGVDRSLDYIRLSGTVYNAEEGMSRSEALEIGLALADREGARPDVVAVNNAEDLSNFKSRYAPNVLIQKHAEVAVNRFYILQTDTWVKFVNDNGTIVAVACTTPGFNATVTL